MNTRVTIEVSPAGAARIISTERVDGQSAAANVETAERVKLDPKAPNFDARKAELKANGYKWNGKTETWVKPANGSATSAASQPDFTDWIGDANEIQLSLDDADFDAKLAALNKAGFKWDRLCNCVKSANGSANGAASQPDFTDWLRIANEITLSQDDVDFVMKKAALTNAGFKWARPFTWIRPANGSANGTVRPFTRHKSAQWVHGRYTG